uniref:L3B25 n=1 Tax=Teladorsagia circumcincta TaxID=45464 RepID=Q8MXD0_TELCI|nr:L3B25 [Teladorsagia circumcincta]AAN73019.1 L3B25 precusor [Teladorsagia circumcincta]
MKLLLLSIFLVACVLSVDGWNRVRALTKGEERTTDDESDSNCCPCHHHCHYHHHKMPPFLKHVSADARWEYYAIIRDMFSSMSEKLKKLDEWAKKQDPEVKKGMEAYFKNIDMYWKDVNKNMTMTLEELPKIYPKVYEIMADLDLTPREIYKKIRDLQMSKMTSHSLYAVAMAVIHTGGAEYPYLMDNDMFFETLATPKIRNLFNNRNTCNN